MAESFEDSKLFCNRNIYIDCSCAVSLETVTGIQRVTNALIASIKPLIELSNKNENVIPVWTDPQIDHFLKAKFDKERYKLVEHPKMDDIVQFHDGDILLMPDLHTANIVVKQNYLKHLVYCRGVKVFTVLYDLIPVHNPDFFHPDFVKEFLVYLNTISQLSGIITDSKSVFDDYIEWKNENNIKSPKWFKETWFHLGCDFTNAISTKKRENEDFSILENLKKKTTFLVVSTIEPRKMHKQILNAFDCLWAKNHDVNLVFVGRYGWKMDDLKCEIENHSELGKHFYWLKEISDEFLDKIYQSSSCIIFASKEEGFGLSIIEGAQHGKPLILRDIPVFREVAKDKAFYFSGFEPTDLSTKIQEWLILHSKNMEPKSEGIECLTWKEASEIFLKRLEFIS